MNESLGYARCSLDEQDLTAQRGILLGLGVAEERIYLDHGLTGTNRDRPGLAQALAAVRAGDTLVVPKLDRLARSVPDARDIGDSLTARSVKLSLGGALYDPGDPMGKMFFNILATFAEFEVDLLRMRTREGMAVAKAKGKLRGKQPKLTTRQQAHLVKEHRSGEHTIADLAELFSVSRATVYRVLERHQTSVAPSTSAGSDVLPFVYRITKYDPADRDESGSYIGTAEAVSDHGPVESAYLQAVAAFAEHAGIDRLAVREPQIAPGLVEFGAEPAIEGHGLAGLFPSDLAGFHDGALVSLALGLELVRAMLRDNGAWCRLEVEGRFTIHVGWDQYIYISSSEPCEEALARTRALGLFPERLDASPYDADYDEPGEQRPADDVFWARLRWCVAMRQAAILEEIYADNATRWHRLNDGTLDEVRARLTPRAQLAVWPDLSTDVAAVLAGLPEEGLIELVWEGADGQITSTTADETQFGELAAKITGARAAAALSMYTDERQPLFTAVLPDSDGVLRARWRTEPTQSDRHWAILKTLCRGQVITGTVTEIASFGVTFVDIGGFTAMINIPELSWRHIDYPSDVVTVGQEITAEILDVDMVRERVPLSLKALQADPMLDLARQVGQIVTGPVTKLVPFGAFVRVEDSEDGFEGLVHNTELADAHVERPEDVVQVGEALTVKILEVDPTRRRIALSHKQALAVAPEGHRHS